jgi:hypothetical protein
MNEDKRRKKPMDKGKEKRSIWGRVASSVDVRLDCEMKECWPIPIMYGDARIV